MKTKEQIKEAYKSKILGVRNYKSTKREFLVDDFLELEKLVTFLDEVGTGESDITPAGKKFLEIYYGLDNLVNLVVSFKNFPKKREIEFREYMENIIKHLTPMQTIAFIEQTRGNIGQDYSLREDLLPPKNE